MTIDQSLLQLQESTRKLVDELLKEESAFHRLGTVPEIVEQRLREGGYYGLCIPERFGGLGIGTLGSILVQCELARLPPQFWTMLRSAVGPSVKPLINVGSQAQRDHWLPRIARGECGVGIAMTEAHAGSDVSSIRTSAVKKKDRYVINGTKMFISNADRVDLFTLFAYTDRGASMRTKAVRDGDDYVLNGQKAWVSWGVKSEIITIFAKTGDVDRRGVDNISCFIVERDTPGLSFGRQERKMGVHGVPCTPMYLDNVRVPAANRIADEGRGFIAAMRILDLNRPTVGAMAVGLAQGAIDTAVEFAKTRRQFGKAIGEFQAIQFMLADMRMNTEAARLLVYDCARQIDRGQTDGMAARSAMAKAFPTDVAMRVTGDAVQILGAAGYSSEYPVERMFRDAKINQIWEGTNQIQRLIIAREMLRA